ncbi:PREDICTED: auxin-responsive protein SAUR71-like [Lupinus angustifolius]|uniref:auxin-responsive protein SAUR71-like n=1 Tax=Lupinus angustifolius TaxID=3871 RepID=UPI00092EA00A|nr:PREDICTED: auxin-responsive protein SAUR71-like [Lupinus angustifolius]
MKHLIRKLSRFANSSHYTLLRSESRSSCRRHDSRRRRNGEVPEGHIPVYVGEEMERFVVSTELLNHPVFIMLLNRSAQEYGYHQKGVLRIPCHVIAFERLLEALRLGLDSRDLHHLITSEEVRWRN